MKTLVELKIVQKTDGQYSVMYNINEAIDEITAAELILLAAEDLKKRIVKDGEIN